jgi:GNAT superfamily N-acetyltransferase
LSKELVVGKALMANALALDNLLSEWFDWKPITGRLSSVRRAVRKKELLVAKTGSRVIGFIHYVMHEDLIDGSPNAFISAFYVSERDRGKGVGSLLLESAIADSLARGAVGVETSTIHTRARQLYERHHFKQTVGDIGEVFLELDLAEYLQAKKSG